MRPSPASRARAAAGRLRRALRGRLRPGPAILMYHRVAVAAYDPWRLAVAPERFAAQAAWLKRRRTVLPLQTFAELHRAGRLPANALALTFDDGYACNAEVAAPILESLDLPATVFVTTGALAVGAEFWWDRLEHLVDCAPAGPFAAQVGDERLSYDFEPGPIRPGSRREAAYMAIWAAVRLWPEARRAELLAALGQRLGAPPTPRADHRVMTEAQAKSMAASGLIALGAHTVRHPVLNALAADLRRAEIEDSRAACARLTGQAPQLFAYPYGDYDEATVEAVRAAGFDVAVTTDEALVAPGCDCLRLPRLQVGDWTVPQLAAALAR